jgi:hypothetical protein
VRRGPDRNLVLESRGLLEGQLKKVGAKFGSQGGCNYSVVGGGAGGGAYRGGGELQVAVAAARLPRAWPANTNL